MDSETSNMVRVFKALGDPTRLRIYELLRSCCCAVGVDDSGGVSAAGGPTAGEVCCSITGNGVINSTISHHIKELREAGLITVERRGKHMVCGIDRGMEAKLASYFGTEISRQGADIASACSPGDVCCQ